MKSDMEMHQNNKSLYGYCSGCCGMPATSAQIYFSGLFHPLPTAESVGSQYLPLPPSSKPSAEQSQAWELDLFSSPTEPAAPI